MIPAESSAIQSQYLANVSNIMNATSAQVTSIYQTQGLTAAQQQAAVQTAYQQMDAQIKSIQSFYSASPLWTGPGASNSGGTPAPPPPPPTTGGFGPGPGYGK